MGDSKVALLVEALDRLRLYHREIEAAMAQTCLG
jgi:hypothetical protein